MAGFEFRKGKNWHVETLASSKSTYFSHERKTVMNKTEKKVPNHRQGKEFLFTK